MSEWLKEEVKKTTPEKEEKATEGKPSEEKEVIEEVAEKDFSGVDNMTAYNKLSDKEKGKYGI